MASANPTHLLSSVGATIAADLTFEAISKRYDNGQLAVDDVSFHLSPGEIVCLLGPSGSGKSTLLRLAAGIEQPTSGRLLMNNQEIAGPNVFVEPEHRSIGLVFQDYALFPHMNVLKNVHFGLTALSRREAEKEGRLALERVGLAHYAETYPHLLSGGERQRVALARALAPRPSVLLMDEAFSGLDSQLREMVRTDTLRTLKASRATAMLVTHDAEEAMRMGDRIGLLKDGRMIQIGTMRELYHQPNSLFVAKFFSEINQFEGVAQSGKVGTPLGAVHTNLADGTNVVAGFRVSDISLNPENGSLGARIVARRFLGEHDLIDVVVEGYEVPIRMRTTSGHIPPDRQVGSLNVDLARALVFEKAVETS